MIDHKTSLPVALLAALVTFGGCTSPEPASPVDSLRADAGKLCPPNTSEASFDFVRGTAHFTGKACRAAATADSQHYFYALLEINDTNARLPESVRGKTVKYEGSARVAQHVQLLVPAHNVCESTIITTPDATYAFTFFGGRGGFKGGCAPIAVLPGAPTGGLPMGHPAAVKWTAKYGTTPLIGGLASLASGDAVNGGGI